VRQTGGEPSEGHERLALPLNLHPRGGPMKMSAEVIAGVAVV
jgi:hypothetical protein